MLGVRFPFVKQEAMQGVTCLVSPGMALVYFFSVMHELSGIRKACEVGAKTRLGLPWLLSVSSCPEGMPGFAMSGIQGEDTARSPSFQAEAR